MSLDPQTEQELIDRGVPEQTIRKLERDQKLREYRAANGITVREGVEYHACGRRADECRMRNGLWWCEWSERACEPEGRDTGLHRDSMG